MIMLIAWLGNNWRGAILIASCLFSFIGGYELKSTFVRAAESKRLVEEIKEQQEQQAKADQAVNAWEKQLSELRDNNIRLNWRLANEIKSKDIYHTCNVPTNGLRALSSAVSGHPSGKPDK